MENQPIAIEIPKPLAMSAIKREASQASIENTEEISPVKVEGKLENITEIK